MMTYLQFLHKTETNIQRHSHSIFIHWDTPTLIETAGISHVINSFNFFNILVANKEEPSYTICVTGRKLHWFYVNTVSYFPLLNILSQVSFVLQIYFVGWLDCFNLCMTLRFKTFHFINAMNNWFSIACIFCAWVSFATQTGSLSTYPLFCHLQLRYPSLCMGYHEFLHFLSLNY